MKNNSIIIGLMTLLCSIFTSCSKTDPQPDFANGELAPFSIEFDNIVGERTFAITNTGSLYTNAAGEKFSISKLQYFISNIKVTKANGNSYTVPQDQSYFLINGEDKSTRFTKIEVPEGDYTKVTFTLGVDSLRSTMDLSKRTGVLDPATGGGHDSGGMYWGWNSGYIFFKLEGTSPVISDDVKGDPTGKKQFKYHIGGFGGFSAPTINNIKTITIDLNAGGIAKVRKGRQSNVHLFVDIMKVFNGKNSFSIAANPNVMFSAFSVNVANNLPEMFRHDHTEN
ncbi:MbnP family protein [Pedobacter flavus]|uniref:MbnP family protein n=1 Tax=Pedobacter flavus TaxID=3113906 RepID=A0ABU7GYM1_9SPHI|nr:MbnP family protein [Pedobacter sp. VNH31]MEE1884118.1 MbnP family protein [Pedobacter sp. VNH31]